MPNPFRRKKPPTKAEIKAQQQRDADRIRKQHKADTEANELKRRRDRKNKNN